MGMVHPKGDIMGRFILSFLIALCFTQPVLAGAWLRQEGQAFTAFSVTAYQSDEGALEYKSSLYAEWGLLDWMTVGLDANNNQVLDGHAVLFGRFPLAVHEKAGRVSIDLGVGFHHRSADWRPMYKTTLSYGNSLPTKLGNVWLAIDAGLEIRTGENRVRKLDLTSGISSSRRLDPLLQIETYRIHDQPSYWSVTPSLMIRSPSIKTRWIMGVQKNSLAQRVGLKLALWRDF